MATVFLFEPSTYAEAAVESTELLLMSSQCFVWARRINESRAGSGV